ncbi:MAG: tRNA glutamyl-Q(34) synthetase GluQRS [Caulobacterales bacterium]
MSAALFVTRFAPSPTGLLHKGHAFSALTAHAAALQANGRFILRIEDIDFTRCRPGFETAIYEDLTWLGLAWETPARRQSEHLDEYRAVIERLAAEGLAYRCFKTRKQILDDIGRAPHGPPEGYRGAPLATQEESRRVASGEPFAWRLSLSEAERRLGGFGHVNFTERGAGPNGETARIAADPWSAGDVILARKDVGVSYHLAVVWDDALQGVTQVIRGRDLFEATHIQRVLQALLGLPEPLYRHHRLLTGPDGKRLAKRDRAETLAAMRARGVTVEALRAELGF